MNESLTDKQTWMSCNKVSTWTNQAFVQALVPLVLLFTNIDLDCYEYYGVFFKSIEEVDNFPAK